MHFLKKFFKTIFILAIIALIGFTGYRYYKLKKEDKLKDVFAKNENITNDSYYDSQIVMVVNSQGPYAEATSLEDFENAKVTAQLNTFHYSLVDQIPGADPQEAMIDFATMRVSLLAGKIDAYISERPEGLSAEMADPNYKMIVINEGFELNKEERVTAIGLEKGSDLVDDINEILAGISAEERNKLMDQAMLDQPLMQ